MKRMRKWMAGLAAGLLAVAVLCTQAAAYTPYDSFNFVYRQGKLSRAQCPAPFYPVRIIDKAGEGIPLSAPADIFAAPDGYLYLVDQKAGLLVKMSAELQPVMVLDGPADREEDLFRSPEGVFVDEEGKIYVADTENHRVVVLNSDGSWIKAIENPQNEVLGTDYIFAPRKVAVAGGDRLLVVAQSQVNGIMEFDGSGRFIGFLGSNQVSASPLEILLRSLLTKEQRDKMLQFIPLEYNNLCVDNEGFIYGVTKATDQADKIKKLNLGGEDVLLRSEYMTMATQMSQIEDICTDAQGNYSYIDSRDGKIYTYNQDGYLLYAFGGLSSQAGTFQSPSAIEYAAGQLLVCDAVRGCVTVFERTPYAQAIEDADSLFRRQDYDASRQRWEDTLRMNCNFELAYIQIGRILYRQDAYGEAMDYFKKGNFRGENYVSGYGMAFEKYRAVFLQENLQLILTILAAAAAALILLAVWRRHRRKRG